MSRKRYEEEIDEILKKLDGTLPSEPLTARARTKLQRLGAAFGQALSGVFSHVQVGHFMLLSLALMLAAVFLPLPLGWQRAVGILGLLLFLSAFVLSLKGRRGARYEPRWRGRTIRDDQGQLPAWLRRLLGRS